MARTSPEDTRGLTPSDDFQRLMPGGSLLLFLLLPPLTSFVFDEDSLHWTLQDALQSTAGSTIPFVCIPAALYGAYRWFMSAAVALALGLCSQGDRLVVQRDSYGGTTALLKHDLARFGIGVAIVDAYDHEAVKAALAAGAKALLVESISNPLMKTVDLEGLAGLCKGAGAQLVVDNTFATPIACRPLERGADLVWHSVTKFIGGHHDLCAGAIVGSRELVGAVEPVARRMPPRRDPGWNSVPDPDPAVPARRSAGSHAVDMCAALRPVASRSLA